MRGIEKAGYLPEEQNGEDGEDDFELGTPEGGGWVHGAWIGRLGRWVESLGLMGVV